MATTWTNRAFRLPGSYAPIGTGSPALVQPSPFARSSCPAWHQAVFFANSCTRTYIYGGAKRFLPHFPGFRLGIAQKVRSGWLRKGPGLGCLNPPRHGRPDSACARATGSVRAEPSRRAGSSGLGPALFCSTGYGVRAPQRLRLPPTRSALKLFLTMSPALRPPDSALADSTSTVPERTQCQDV